jgi:hypothetical protein
VIVVGFVYNAVRPALIKMQVLKITPREA